MNEARDQNKEEVDFDTISNNSGYAEWIYKGYAATSSPSTNDKVVIVSATDRSRLETEKLKRKEIIVIPKLDFERIDRHR